VKELSTQIPLESQPNFKQIFQSLKVLNFTKTFVDSNADEQLIQVLNSCPQITHLILDKCKITDQTMKFIAKSLQNLEFLSCVGCKQITTVPVVELEQQMYPKTIADNLAISTSKPTLEPPMSKSPITKVFSAIDNLNTFKRTTSEKRNLIAKFSQKSSKSDLIID
jgi:hypothetical protein